MYADGPANVNLTFPLGGEVEFSQQGVSFNYTVTSCKMLSEFVEPVVSAQKQTDETF